MTTKTDKEIEDLSDSVAAVGTSLTEIEVTVNATLDSKSKELVAMVNELAKGQFNAANSHSPSLYCTYVLC